MAERSASRGDIETVELEDDDTTLNQEIHQVDDGEVLATNTRAIASRARYLFWVFSFLLFHAQFMMLLTVTLIKHGEWKAVTKSVIIASAFTVLGFLAFFFYMWLVRILVMMGRYKILVHILGVVLHQVLVLNNKSEGVYLTLFALHTTSIICFIRTQVEGDPSGFILIVTLSFVRSAASHPNMDTLVSITHVVCAIVAVVALILDVDGATTIVQRLRRLWTLVRPYRRCRTRGTASWRRAKRIIV